MSVKIKGLKEFQRELKKAQRKVKQLEGTHHVDGAEVLTDEFMSANTQFSSLNELLAAIGIHNQDELEAYPQEEFDKKIKELTGYESIGDLIAHAYMTGELDKIF